MNKNSQTRSPGMGFRALSLLFALATLSSAVLAQTQDQLMTTAAALIVEIDARGAIKLNETAAGTVSDTTRLKSRLKQIFESRLRNRVYADRDGASQTHIPLDERIAKGVLVQPNASLSYTALLKVLSDIRAAGASPLNVELTRGDISHLATIPTPARSQTDAVPNPYFLLASVGPDRKIELNRERVPSMNALTGRLMSIFEQRQKDHAFVPDTKQISRTVGLRLDRRLTVSTLGDLMEAVGLASSSPIVLLIDEPSLSATGPVAPTRKPAKSTSKQTRRP